MTKVAELMMLKTYPFLTVIRSFELRYEYEELLEQFDRRMVPKKYQQLNLDTAKWFVKTGYRKFRPCPVLTKLVKCCKEYSNIGQTK